jgi:hypothetical protein
MPGFVCSEHPGAAALFSCDGCARLLCGDCVKEGHRLYFCVHCGERAVAMELRASSNVAERRRAERVERPYSFAHALGYCFRGSGKLMLPAYVASMIFAAMIPGFGAAVACVVALLLPGLVFEIVRTTAEGEVELPDWPDYSDTFQRFLEGVWMLSILLASLAPMALFFYLADCDALALVSGRLDAACLAPLAAGLAVGTTLGVFALGATGTHSSGWLSFRIDLHLRALLTRAAPDALRAAALLAALFFAAALVHGATRGIPLLGAAIAAALNGYAYFTGAHLVGLVFRRHGEVLDPIYRE